ncbi:MAG: hypothetical protein HY923_01300 [Elusimicrobia bacterium]|nr:hypothetical protein [Elusimicrobiota bacterium]
MLIPAALSLLLASAPARAASLKEAQENVETIIQTYVAQKSPEGFWPVKQKGGGNLRLKLKSIDAKNVRRTSGELFKVSATFTDEESRKPYYGEFDVDFGGMIWSVKRSGWVTRAMLDANKEFKFAGGVPHLFVSEDGGRIIKDQAGFWEDPMSGADLASYLNLP